MMSDISQSVYSISLTAITGIGVCLGIVKYRSKIFHRFRSVSQYNQLLRNQSISIVTNVEECEELMWEMRSHCNKFNVLGFDCEWVSVGSTRKNVALLQLASRDGLCGLIRLSHLQSFPDGLKSILEDEKIIKVGVGSFDDANHLARDYNVNVASTLDLRYLAPLRDFRNDGLAKLSETYLNVKLDKSKHITCSDWESAELSPAQVDYAAKDALVSIELFEKFADRLSPKPFLGNSTKHTERFLNDYCFGFYNLNYTKTTNRKKSPAKKVNGTESNNVLGRDFKTERMLTLQKPSREYCFLQEPNGEVLSTCNERKAMWFVNKGLGEVIAEDPLTVRLKFEPAYREIGEPGKFQRAVKRNQCVVCGQAKEFTRRCVVPREYRKLFPDVMKKHMWHDIVLICPPCNQKLNKHTYKLRKKLADQCDAPFDNKIYSPLLTEVKSMACELLLKRKKIPESRITELYDRLKHFSDDFLKAYRDVETWGINEHFKPHPVKVVEFFKKSEQGLLGFEEMLREHFLSTMQPAHLPDFWSVKYNTERMKILVDKGRLDVNDPENAGIFGVAAK